MLDPFSSQAPPRFLLVPYNFIEHDREDKQLKDCTTDTVHLYMLVHAHCAECLRYYEIVDSAVSCRCNSCGRILNNNKDCLSSAFASFVSQSFAKCILSIACFLTLMVHAVHVNKGPATAVSQGV